MTAPHHDAPHHGDQEKHKQQQQQQEPLLPQYEDVAGDQEPSAPAVAPPRRAARFLTVFMAFMLGSFLLRAAGHHHHHHHKHHHKHHGGKHHLQLAQQPAPQRLGALQLGTQSVRKLHCQPLEDGTTVVHLPFLPPPPPPPPPPHHDDPRVALSRAPPCMARLLSKAHRVLATTVPGPWHHPPIPVRALFVDGTISSAGSVSVFRLDPPSKKKKKTQQQQHVDEDKVTVVLRTKEEGVSKDNDDDDKHPPIEVCVLGLAWSHPRFPWHRDAAAASHPPSAGRRILGVGLFNATTGRPVFAPPDHRHVLQTAVHLPAWFNGGVDTLFAPPTPWHPPPPHKED